MITEDYCSYEVAKLLKEKGFDIPCHYTYHGDITSVPFFHRKVKNFNGEEYSGKTTEWVSCPTLQMAMKWLREVHKICIEISPVSGKGYGAILCDVGDFDDFNYIGETDYFFHPEEAIDAALKYVLENLI